MADALTTLTDPDSWNRALYAFLAEKERHSGSRRTVEGYSRMLRHFFDNSGKPPDRIVSQDVFAWAYSPGDLRQATVIGDDRRSPCLPQLLLPLPHPHGGRRLQPL